MKPLGSKPTFSCRESALHSLSRRDHGEYELRQKLRQKGYPDDEIDDALNYCLEHHYLDDLRFAKSQVRQHVYKGHGLRRIKQELSMKKVVDSVITEALEEEPQDWFELAKLAAEKKYKGISAADSKEYAKRVRYLQYRGFDFEQIKYALAG